MPDLVPASFRGVPFAVKVDTIDGGRRNAKHTYPGKDGVYPEDLGRRGRGYRIQGFLVSDDVVYGGGPVALQRQLLIAAMELGGSGLLIHPTLGALTVSAEAYSISNDLGAATSADVELTFVEYTQQSFLGISAATISQVLTAAIVVDAAASAAFTVANVLGQSGSAASARWSGAVVAGGQDATALTNLAAQLPGPYGRYFAGANAGYLTAGSGSVYSGDTSVAALMAAAATARAALSSAYATVTSDFQALTTASAAQAAADVQALVAALLAACADPADALRILSALASEAPTGVTGVDDLYRRAAVNAVVRASTTYQPASQNDAQAVQAMVTGLIDNEVTVAGDEGDDASFAAFRSLRSMVVADLQARGAALAPLQTFSFNTNLPALVLAERLYGDATRADQLISEVDPVHPLFMPITFEVLAS